MRRHLPPLDELIESGKVLALNMPSGSNPALARAIGVFLKNAWLQTLLRRPAQMKADSGRYFRPAVFICDEYQSFASVGEDDPSGDEKAFALTRQCRVIPIVATQSISSLRSVLGTSEAWRALLQTLRTRIFLSLSDDASADIASKLCGQVARIKPSWTVTESAQQAQVSLLSGKAGGTRGSVGTSKSFREQREALFQPREFGLLPNCQAICLPYDGTNATSAVRVYLKPYYLPETTPYWRAIEAGEDMNEKRGMDYLRPFLPGLESVLEDEDVSEIMINGPRNVWIESRGEIREHPAPRLDAAALDRAAIQIARPLGLDPATAPILDARLGRRLPRGDLCAAGRAAGCHHHPALRQAELFARRSCALRLTAPRSAGRGRGGAPGAAKYPGVGRNGARVRPPCSMPSSSCSPPTTASFPSRTPWNSGSTGKTVSASRRGGSTVNR